MEVLDIYFKVKNLESNDIYTLLESRGVNIFHTPELFRNSNSKGRIITDIFGNTSIFLRFKDGENPYLERFILWHELGHLETEGISPMARAFNLDYYREEDESDQNVFALFCILNDHNALDISPVELAEKTGVPFSIILNCYNRIRQDEKFMAYINKSE